MRAAARTADLGPEPAGEGLVEAGADEAQDAVGGIAAALSAGDRGRFEGHGGLAEGDGVEDRSPRVDLAVEQHVVHDAGGLELACDRHEAALAEVDQLAVCIETSVGPLGERDGEGPRVQRMAAEVEVHRGLLWRRAAHRCKRARPVAPTGAAGP